MKTVYISVGSLTLAQKASKILNSAAIGARIIKLNTTEEGCTYGIEIPYERLFDARGTLKKNNIDATVIRPM